MGFWGDWCRFWGDEELGVRKGGVSNVHVVNAVERRRNLQDLLAALVRLCSEEPCDEDLAGGGFVDE